MGILLYDQPPAYSLAYNDNVYVMKSTNYTPTQRFKIDVLPSDYPITPALATMRVYPRVSVGLTSEDRAYFDPSRILQSLLTHDISIPSANHSTFFTCPNSHTNYSLRITEEDKVNGVYVPGAKFKTSSKTVWNGVRNTREWLDFDYTDYDVTSSSSGIKFLSDAPTTRHINTGQSAFLHFISSDQSPTGLTLKSYNSTGGLITTAQITFASPIFGRAAVGPYDIVNSDPADWTSSTPTTFLNNITYYTVQLRGGAQQVIRFNLDQQCSKYTPIRLQWLNRLGGFDCFNFNLKSEEETKIKRASYEQQHHTFTGTRWNYSAISRGQTDYDVQTSDKITINTDFLTEAESTWMNDLVTSPVIFQELNNELIAVNIDERSIKKQTSLNDKLMQYTFDLEYSLRNMRQRG